MKMPGDVLPVMLSTGVGVGLLGVVSGVCFLVYNGYAYARRVRKGEDLRLKGEQDKCSSCKDLSQGVCSSCSLPVCNECSFRDQGQRKCQACCNDRLYFSSELENNGFLRLLRDTLYSYSSDNLHRSRGGSTTLSALASSKSEGEIVERHREEEGRQVRDFLQKLAEHFAGGSLEDVTVGKMYHHPEYLPQTNGPALEGVASGAAASAQVRLQQLVQRVIEEALKLPALLDCSGIERNQDGSLPEFNPKTYEDLLATAILNKVIDRYQTETKKSNGASSSGVHSGSSSPGDFGRGSRGRRKHAKRDSSPEPSSLEPMSHDDYAHSDSSGRMSGTPAMIDERSLQKNAYSTDEEEPHQTSFNNPVDGALSSMNFRHNSRVQFPEYGGDIVEINESTSIHLYENKRNSNGSSVTGNGEIYANNTSWEENWLFQKKKIKPQSVPVPMLIPNSNTEYKAMIGDRDADDTTDLSDLGSDLDENASFDIKQILIDSKSIIGGKNPEIVEILVDDGLKDEDNEQNEYNINETTVIEDSMIVNKIDENGNDRSMPVFNKHNKNVQEEPSNNILKSFLKHLECDDDSSHRSKSKLDDKLNSKYIAEATNLDVVDCKDNGNLESLDNQQQEGEYIETIAKPVQRHMDSLKRQHNITTAQKMEEFRFEQDLDEPPPPLPSSPMPTKIDDVDIILDEATPMILLNGSSPNKETEVKEIKAEENTDDSKIEKEIDDFSLPHKPGTIAEREHKKWLNAVPMENNPYSPEAIKSRLDKKNSSSIFPTITKIPPTKSTVKEVNPDVPTLQRVLSKDVTENVRYERDYYINEAKRSTGARKKKPDFRFDSDNFIRSDESDNDPLSSAPVTETEKNVSELNQADVYSATPVIVEDTQSIENQFDELYKKATKIESEDQDIYILPVDLNDKNVEKLLKLTNGTIISDSFDQSDSISSLDETPRIYNVETGKIIKQLKDDLYGQSKVNDAPKESSVNGKEYKKIYGEMHANFENSSIVRAKEDVNIPSVKDLARKFIKEEKETPPPPIPKPRRVTRELFEGDVPKMPTTPSSERPPASKQPQHMHSLTARSISKEFREGLKLSMPVTSMHPGGSKSVPSGLNQLVKGGSSESLVPEPGSLKNKLAFFEKLSNKQ